ncbi:MAG: response regulator [Bacteroidota bacterium]
MMNAKKEIIVVEDNEIDFFALKRAFRKVGIPNPLVHFENGEQAYNYLLSQGEYAQDPLPEPLLVLLDLNLPEMHGLEILQSIRAHEKQASIPVIVVSSTKTEEEIKACYRMGANSFVAKEIAFDSFIKKVSNLKSFWLETAELPVNMIRS